MPTPSNPPERFPYGSRARCHLQHAHLFASDLDQTLTFYKQWFDARVAWDGQVGGARSVLVQIGKGALHFYDQPPRDTGRGAIHHLGIQVVGLGNLYERMKAGGVRLPHPIRLSAGGGGYFMIEAPDHVLIELFEPGADIDRDPALRDFFGFGPLAAPEAVRPAHPPRPGETPAAFPKASATNKAEIYRELANQARGLLAGERNLTANAANFAALAFNALPDISWCGFYFPDGAGDGLVVGPFQGKPACVRLARGQGVCGAAVTTRRTQVVPDVTAFPGHIYCDGAARSEIVVPLFAPSGELIGVWDVDSYTQARFDDTDRAGMEALCAEFARSVESAAKPTGG